MAKAKTFPLAIVLSAVDKTTAGFLSAIKGIDNVAKRAKKLGKTSSDIGKSLSRNLTLPIVGIGVASVAAFSDFEAGMGNVNTLIDSSTENISEMSNTVLEMSKDLPVPISTLTAGLYDLRSAGVAVDDQFIQLEKSAKLAVAGLGTTSQAVDLTTSAVASFNLTGEKAANVHNILIKAVKNGKLTIASMSQGFGAMAGDVKKSGTEFDEFIAIVAALSTKGVPASVIYTQMTAVMSGLGRKTKDTTRVFRKLGVKTFPELISKSGGMANAIKAISDALGGNQTKLKALLGSTQALSAVNAIAGDQFSKVTDNLADMRSKVDQLGASFSKQNATTQAAIQKTKNSIEASAISIGKSLAPLVAKIAKRIEDLVSWFSGLDEGTKSWLLTIAGAAAILGPAAMAIGGLSVAIGIATGAIALVTAELAILKVAIMTNPILALVGLIAIAALSIYENWEDFEDFFALLWGGVKNIFTDAWDWIREIVDKIVGAAKKVQRKAEDVKNFITGDVREQQFSQEFLDKAAASEMELLRPARRSSPSEAPLMNGGEAKVVVEFKGAPQGTQVASSSAGLELVTETGYQMGGL